MDFVIYSIGSGAYLTEVLLAVTAITGSGDFMRLMQIGMVLGIIILGFQTIMNGGREINIGQIAAAFLLFALMFGPRVDVAVQGVYDRHNQAVSDVPIGIAAPGAFVSQIGLGLTRMFETAFAPLTSSTAPTGLSQGGGFVDALKVLNAVRRGATDTSLLSALDEVHPGFRRSWDDYLRYCTSNKILRGDATIEEIYHNPFSDTNGMRFNSQVFTTRLHRNGNVTNASCSDAWVQLEAWTNDVSQGTGLEAVLRRLIRPEGAPPAAVAEGTIAPSASGEINNALDMLGRDATQAQEYIRLALLEPIFLQAMGGRYKDFFDSNTAVMINQALDQRNVQWAGEQTVFMSVVRPMMTFIEGFAYSITPFAAFILLLGGFGMKLAIKYGQMLLWIQLWLPVLAMTNMYLHSVAATELANLDNFSNSFYALSQADQRLQHWISVGGMLAAATPVLTLVLLTGSTYAMTSLAGRMHAGDHVNEKVSSPDAVQPAPVMQQAAMYQHSAGSGRVLSGAESSLFSIQVSETAQSVAQSARQDMTQAQSAITGAVQESFKDGSTLTQSDARTRSLSDALSTQNTTASTALTGLADQLSSELGISQSQARAVMAQQAIGGRAGVGLNQRLGKALGVSLGAEYSAKLATSDTFSDDMTIREALQRTQQLNLTEQDAAQLSEGLAHELTNTSSEQLADTWGQETAHTMKTAASEMRSSSQTYQTAESLANSSQFQEGLRADRLGHMARDESVSTSVNERFRRLASTDQQQSANQRAARLASTYGMSAPAAQLAAQLEQLHRGTPEQQQAFLEVLSQATGGGYSGTGDAQDNQTLRDRAIPSPQSVGGGATQSLPETSISGAPDDAREQIGQRMTEYESNVAAADRENQRSQGSALAAQQLESTLNTPQPMALSALTRGLFGDMQSRAGEELGYSNRVLSGNRNPTTLAADTLQNLPDRVMQGKSDFQLNAYGSNIRLSGADNVRAMGVGMMTPEQRAEYEQQNGEFRPTTPGQVAAMKAGEAWRDAGGNDEANLNRGWIHSRRQLANLAEARDAARDAYHGVSASSIRELYESDPRFRDSPAAVSLVTAMHMPPQHPEARQMYEGAVDGMALEMARAHRQQPDLQWSSVDETSQARYRDYAERVAVDVGEHAMRGDRTAGLARLQQHAQSVRLSGQ